MLPGLKKCMPQVFRAVAAAAAAVVDGGVFISVFVWGSLCII